MLRSKRNTLLSLQRTRLGGWSCSAGNMHDLPGRRTNQGRSVQSQGAWDEQGYRDFDQSMIRHLRNTLASTGEPPFLPSERSSRRVNIMSRHAAASPPLSVPRWLLFVTTWSASPGSVLGLGLITRPATDHVHTKATSTSLTDINGRQ